jgi:LPS sulfotransferase NodH
VPQAPGDDSAATLIQSSGSTGEPKSFYRSHHQEAAWIGRYLTAHDG